MWGKRCLRDADDDDQDAVSQQGEELNRGPMLRGCWYWLGRQRSVYVCVCGCLSLLIQSALVSRFQIARANIQLVRDGRGRWVVTTTRPFGEQSHPSRRAGCIKRSYSNASNTLNEGGAIRGQAQLPADEQQEQQEHGGRLSLSRSFCWCAHGGLQHIPVTWRPLAGGRTPLPAASTVPLRVAGNHHRTCR
jgi:hypothetical protein